MQKEPRTLVQQLEAAATLPPGSNERFGGYGVMGLPFRSGHVLAMRRFFATSVGPGYSSVWHRDPAGDWMFYGNVSARESCPRYFGAIAADTVETEITIAWTTPFSLRIAMPAVAFEWEVEARATAATRLMNAMGGLLPNAAWHNGTVLSTMGLMAGPLLRVGRVGLHGRAPNGQRFVANPRVMWAVTDSRAKLGKEDFGPPGAAEPQAHLGDFWIPQRGMLAIGEAYFDPFDPKLHSSKTSRSAAEAD